MEGHSLQIQSVLYNNEKPSLLKALNSIYRAVEINHNGTCEVGNVTVFYGDASPEKVFSDEEVKEISERFGKQFEFKYLFFGENTGSAKGHNKLGDLCDSEYMMIMNPDVVICPRYFEKMFIPFLDPACEAGMVEARQTPVEHPKEYDKKTLETDWATTACAIFTTEMFRKLNGFDYETFFLYCDDIDFSWRVRMEGKKIYYRPDAIVFHAKTLSAGGSWKPTSAEVYFSAEASILMAYKWSNTKRALMLVNNFQKSGDETLMKAAAHFEELRQNGKLPVQLDPKHKVAKFVGDNYANHRFAL